MTTKCEIKNKIKNGIYKLLDTPPDKNPLWKVFTKISDGHGDPITRWVCCRHCKNIIDGNVLRSLSKHPCFVKWMVKHHSSGPKQKKTMSIIDRYRKR